MLSVSLKTLINRRKIEMIDVAGKSTHGFVCFCSHENYFVCSLENKPAMPYSVWEEKLRGKLRNWYKTLADNHQDTNKVS